MLGLLTLQVLMTFVCGRSTLLRIKWKRCVNSCYPLEMMLTNASFQSVGNKVRIPAKTLIGKYQLLNSDQNDTNNLLASINFLATDGQSQWQKGCGTCRNQTFCHSAALHMYIFSGRRILFLSDSCFDKWYTGELKPLSDSQESSELEAERSVDRKIQ